MFRNALNELQFSLRRNLFGKIPLRPGLPRSAPENFLECEYYSSILAAVFPHGKAPAIKQVIDIGCRNWSYVRSLADFFPEAHLIGIEIDGGRRYWNLYRRIDLALAHANSLKKDGRTIEVIGDDFRNLNLPLLSQQVLFCFFFPFVSANPCLRWGLPKRFADFSALLTHSMLLAGRAGALPRWMSIHQGEWEAEEALRVYDHLQFRMETTVLSTEQTCPAYGFPYDTWIFSSEEITAE